MKVRTILAVVITLLVNSARAEQTLILNSSYYPPVTSETHDGVLDLVYRELSRRLGIRIEIQMLPAAERVLLNANEGIIDGDVGRIEGLDMTLYPNLVRVPVPVIKYEFMVFSRNLDFRVAGSPSIMPYHVGIVRGWKIVEQTTTGARSVTAVENAEQMFAMLDKNRLDIVVMEKLGGMELIKRMNLKGVKMLYPALLEGYFYPYLNNKHAALVPRITAELRRMEQEGVLQKIYDSVLSRYNR